MYFLTAFWGVIPDHADQTARSGNAPYRNGKIIYYVCINLEFCIFVIGNCLELGACHLVLLCPIHISEGL